MQIKILFMQDPLIWNMVSRHLTREETREEAEKFLIWVEQRQENKEFFNEVKNVWEGKVNITESSQSNSPLTFLGRFSKQKMKDFVLKQALGNLVGFTIGMWVTASFSHYVLERRNLKNLFGLAGRKKLAVNDIPEWLQKGIAILAGFIVLEIINHFFQTKKHIVIWVYIKEKFYLTAKMRS
ncbi:MAG: hypothetical protein Q7W13_10275 [Bacteroidia bacterium]|nr:hypothetical protein [Bacteroidia bacterium]